MVKVFVVFIKLVVSQFHRVVVKKHMLPYTSVWGIHDAFDFVVVKSVWMVGQSLIASIAQSFCYFFEYSFFIKLS